jgi:hypothetical protein
MTGKQQRGAGGVVVALLSLGLGTASAQGGQVQVSYDVVFVVTSKPGADCPSAAGADSLFGTIKGMEPARGNDDITYTGRLTRDTNFSTCSVATRPNAPDQAYNCSVTIKGKASVPVEFKVYFDNRGGYLQAQDTSVTVTQSSVTGNCNQAEMSEWQRDYGKGSTAGSPDGQQINFDAPLRTGPFPKVWPPDPKFGGDQAAWTLIVKARRP